jgi:hypothetical protein
MLAAVRHFAVLVAMGVATFGVLQGSAHADDPNAPPAPTSEQTAESLSVGTTLTKIEAYPSSIELSNKFDYRQILLTGTTAAGDRIDLTRIAQRWVPLGAASAVSMSPNGLVRASADGQTELKFELAGQSVTIPVTVSGVSSDYKPSFVRDVMPTLSKLGCNAGTCHGSAQGKNGFKLSLRGCARSRTCSRT